MASSDDGSGGCLIFFFCIIMMFVTCDVQDRTKELKKQVEALDKKITEKIELDKKNTVQQPVSVMPEKE